MADNLSPLVNLDLINKIYKTINAQIAERVYDPQHNPGVALGGESSRYSNAFLQALNVQGDATISGSISTGTLNNLTLTATSLGFTISNNAVSRVLTVNSTAALGSNIASENGAITVKSAGTGPTTIIGPSNNTAQFNVKTIIGDTTYTGPITIRSSSTGSTTIIGPSDGTAKLKNGTCVVEDDCSTTNTANKIVKRDANKDISVTSVNGITITENTSDTSTKIGLIKGSTSVTVTGAAVNIDKNLTVSSIATLGAANTGSITVRSGGTGDTTIIGPSSGTVTFTAPADSVQGYVELKNANNNTSILKISSGKNISAFSNLTVGNSSNTGSVAITPKGANALNISSNTTTGDTNTILKSGTCVVEGDLPTATVGSATAATINSWTDNEIHYLATVKASGENQSISAETDSTKKLYIERKTVDNAVTYHFYAGAVHNAVWNDLADCIEVPEDTDLEFGYCYSWNGDRVEKTSRKSKNCIGIHSNTAGLFMGEKPTKTIQTAVAGFALAHIDKIYSEGTPLTWSDDGKLTKCNILKRVLHPERVIATFYKEEKQESWYGVKVNNRHWVKVR